MSPANYIAPDSGVSDEKYAEAILADVPRAYYPLASDVADAAGSADGTPSGALAFISGGNPFGEGCLEANGEYISLPTSVVPAECTVEMLVRVPGNVGGYLAHLGATVNGAGIAIGASGAPGTLGRILTGVFESRAFLTPDTIAVAGSFVTSLDLTLEAERWHHVSLAYKVAQMGARFTVDGVSVVSNTGNSPLSAANEASSLLGNTNGATRMSNGVRVAHVAVYPRILPLRRIQNRVRLLERA